MSTLKSFPNVLLVEDNEEISKHIRTALRNSPCHIVESSSVSHALKVAREKTPRLVLVDVGLIDSNGVDLISMLRTLDETKSVPIVAISSLSKNEDQAKAVRAGCDIYITKPIDTTNLRAKIEMILSGSQKKH